MMGRMGNLVFDREAFTEMDCGYSDADGRSGLFGL